MDTSTIINNRYTIIKELGHGAMGEVFLVADSLFNSRKVALKSIKRDIIDDEVITVFKKEFDVMTRLQHPNLVRVHDFGYDERSDRYYITMEYVDAPSIADMINNKQTFTQDHILDCLVDLCRAIDFIHSRNIIHRDIKPDNILLQDNKALLIDFGLADLGKSDNLIKGTVMFMAPEVLKKNAGPAADIFSLGIILLQVLIDAPFYQDLITREIVVTLLDSEKYHRIYLENLKLLHDSPFYPLIKKMTAYKPQDRPINGAAIIDEINTIFNKTYTIETEQTRQAYIMGTGFVGREKEVNLLCDTLNADDGKAVLVHGSPGIGKTRLFGEFKKFCLLNNVVYLEGNCYEHVTRHYGPITQILDESFYRADKTLLENYGKELKKIVPEHPCLRDITMNPRLEPRQEQVVVNRAIVEYIIAFAGSMNTRTVLYLNDMQWADEASCRVLKLLRKKIPHDASPSLHLYLSSRTNSPCADEQPADDEILPVNLTPFNDNHVKAFIYATFGTKNIGRALNRGIPAIRKMVGGNPFFLQELIKTLVEHHVLKRDTTGWELITSLDQVHIPASLHELVKRHLNNLSLSKQEKQVLNLLSLIDRAITHQELNTLIKMEFLSLLKLKDRELIKTDISENMVYFQIAHDIIRNQIADGIDNVKEQHEYIADGFVNLHKANLSPYLDEIAYHYAQSGNREKACEYLEKAALQAKDNYDNKHALDLFNRLLSILGDEDTIKKIEVLINKGEILRLFCSWNESLKMLKDALEQAEACNAELLYAKAAVMLSITYQRMSNTNEGLVFLEKAREVYTRLGDKPGLAYTYNAFGIKHYILYEYQKALDFHNKSLAICREIGDASLMGRNYINMAYVMYSKGEFTTALTCLDKFSESNRDANIHNLETISIAKYVYGNTYKAMNQFTEALSYYDESIHLSKKIELKSLVNVIYLEKIEIYLAQEDHDNARAYCDLVRRYTDRVKDPLTQARLSLLTARLLHIEHDDEKAVTLLHEAASIMSEEGLDAEISYELWKTTGEEQYRLKSLAQYTALYNKTGYYLSQQRMNELKKNTG